MNGLKNGRIISTRQRTFPAFVVQPLSNLRIAKRKAVFLLRGIHPIFIMIGLNRPIKS
jgi:hypothetical protein